MIIQGGTVATPIPDPLPIEKGGTGATSSLEALKKLGAAATNRVITSADTTTYSGMYRIQQAEDVPTDCRYGQLLVICHSETDTIAQIAMAHDGAKAYIRHAIGMSNGVVSKWEPWYKIYTEENKPTPEEIGAVENTINRGDWKTAGTGVSYWRYETADTAALDLPTSSCFVVVMKDGKARGTAIAYDWLNGHYNMWRNSLHDDSQNNNWSGWKNATESIGAVPTSRTINGKALNFNIDLSASDVNARPNDWMPTAEEIGARPDTWMPTASDVGAAKYEFINGGTIRKTSGGTGFEIHLNPTDPPENGAWFFVHRFSCEGNYLVIATTITNEMYISSKPYGVDWSGWSHLATTNNTVPTSRTINDKALDSNITLSATDVGAVTCVGQISDDADTALTSGMYRIQGASHVPSGCTYGQLVVIHGNNTDTIAQMAYDIGSSRMWVRTGSSVANGTVGKWGNGGDENGWKRVITEDNFSYSNGTLTITI